MTTDETEEHYRLKQNHLEGDRQAIEGQIGDRDGSETLEDERTEQGADLDPTRRID
jgi:hypothetical protein